MALLKRSDRPSSLGESWLSDFFDDDRFFNSPWLRGQNMPAVNVKETGNSFEIELAAPGMQKNDFKIEIDNGILTVSGEKKEEKEQKEEHYTRKEFGYTSFSRSFTLPTNTNEEDVNARYEDGVLKLHVAKKGDVAGSRRKAIAIQ